MRRTALLFLLACAPKPPAPTAATPEASTMPALPAAPVTQRDEAHTEAWHGLAVADPYHALEDSESATTKAWVQAQVAHARAHLETYPHRAPFAARLKELFTYARQSPPQRAGERFFWTANDGTQDQSVLMVADAPEGPGRPLLDPNTWRTDGTAALAEWAPSDDGRLLAYAVADAGSDWRTWRIRDVATGTDLADELKWVKFSGASWLSDGSGFFYSRFPQPPEGDFEARLSNQSVWFHRVGTPQADDVLVWEQPDQPDWGFSATVTEDGKRVFLHVSEGTEEKSRLWWFPVDELRLNQKGGSAGQKPFKLFDAFDANYLYLGQVGNRVWVLTTKEAPKGRIGVIDVRSRLPVEKAFQTVIPEGEDVIESASLVGGRLLVGHLRDAHSVLSIHALDGARQAEVVLPGLGSVAGVSGRAKDTEAFFGFSGYATPGETWRLDLATGSPTLLVRPKIAFDPDAFVTEQVRYASKDGTMVPMFLVHRKDIDRSRPQPVQLYGYGGFNIPLTPSFSVSNLAWVEAGGVLAVANLRGGGEYGEAWHQAGTKLQKQNVFDDFIAAAEWLIAEGWTTQGRIGIHGRSNGGLLVGAALVQRPELFGAAVPGVGVLDMLKYHRWTIGWAWASDYGTADESEAMFQALLAYSPVHNARPGIYPPTLVTTADHDDRVVPAHSFKFGAALQHAQQGEAPILLRIETRGGHGAGTPVSMKIEEEADKLAFLAKWLGL